MAYGVHKPGISSPPELGPLTHYALAGDQTCLLAMQICLQSNCATAGTPLPGNFFQMEASADTNRYTVFLHFYKNCRMLYTFASFWLFYKDVENISISKDKELVFFFCFPDMSFHYIDKS